MSRIGRKNVRLTSGGARMTLIATFAILFTLGCSAPERSGAETDDEKLVAAMAEEHADDSPVPSPAAMGEPRGEIVAQEVVYGEIDGVEATGYLALPARDGGAKPGSPGVIVLHEWWGLNDNIRSMARQLVAHGHFQIDGRKVTVPSALTKPGSVVTLREKSRKNEQIKICLDTAKGRGVPPWLELDADSFQGTVKQLPAREDIVMPIQEQLIVELYSK